ncbi:MAG: nucleoside hydrolase [Planctomycetota bacterium]
MIVVSSCGVDAGKPRLVLDADTGNEQDDLYAIVRLLCQDRFEVVALNSAQFLHYKMDESRAKSVDQSHALNESLVRLVGRDDVPLFRGAEEPFGVPWGGQQPKDSPAAQEIIRLARETPEGEKLVVVCIGASTNLASALRLAPDITPRVAAYLLGFQYDPETRVWNKSEFNIRRDLNAADYLLDLDGLELHVMPASVSKPLTFNRDDSQARNDRMGELGKFLNDRWRAYFNQYGEWVMWDLALVEAMLRPELATEQRRLPPPENAQREIWVYTDIDEAAMRDDYWSVVEARFADRVAE